MSQCLCFSILQVNDYQNYLATNILQKNIILCPTENHSGLEWHEGEYMMIEFPFFWWTIPLGFKKMQAISRARM